MGTVLSVQVIALEEVVLIDGIGPTDPVGTEREVEGLQDSRFTCVVRSEDKGVGREPDRGLPDPSEVLD